jgi:transcriptional regulator with XRE-family HTH domain
MLKTTMTDIAIDLRELMELAGLTFKALGDRIGVNQAQVFRALSGEIKLRPESMKAMEMAIVEAARDRAARLAAVLGVITPSAPIWQEVPQGLTSDPEFDLTAEA